MVHNNSKKITTVYKNFLLHARPIYNLNNTRRKEIKWENNFICASTSLCLYFTLNNTNINNIYTIPTNRKFVFKNFLWNNWTNFWLKKTMMISFLIEQSVTDRIILSWNPQVCCINENSTLLRRELDHDTHYRHCLPQ